MTIDKRWAYHSDGGIERRCERVLAIVIHEHYMGGIIPAWWLQFEVGDIQFTSEQTDNKSLEAAKRAAWKAAKKVNVELKKVLMASKP